MTINEASQSGTPDATTPDEEVRAKRENRLLAERVKHARRSRQLAKITAPWWRSWNVTALAGFVAATMPLTVGIQSYYQKEREIALQSAKFDHERQMAQERQTWEIRSSYLDRLKDPNERRRTLRFLKGATTDAGIQRWATAESAIVDAEVAELERKLQLASREADQADRKADAAMAKDPRRSVDAMRDRAARKRAERDAIAAQLKQWSAAGGSASAGPLSERLRTGLDSLHKCLKIEGTDPSDCRALSPFAESIPSTEDIVHAQVLEAKAAANDEQAFDELMKVKAMFLRSNR